MLRVTLRPSRTLGAALVLAHAAAAFVVGALDAEPVARCLLWAAIAAGCGYALLRHAWLRLPGALTALEIRGDGGVAALTRAGEWIDVRILGSSYVTPRLTIVNVRPAGRLLALHLVIVTDNANGDDARRLRVWLRWRYRGSRGTAAEAAMF